METERSRELADAVQAAKRAYAESERLLEAGDAAAASDVRLCCSPPGRGSALTVVQQLALLRRAVAVAGTVDSLSGIARELPRLTARANASLSPALLTAARRHDTASAARLFAAMRGTGADDAAREQFVRGRASVALASAWGGFVAGGTPAEDARTFAAWLPGFAEEAAAAASGEAAFVRDVCAGDTALATPLTADVLCAALASLGPEFAVRAAGAPLALWAAIRTALATLGAALGRAAAPGTQRCDDGGV
jgi:hypothetical protein